MQFLQQLKTMIRTVFTSKQSAEDLRRSAKLANEAALDEYCEEMSNPERLEEEMREALAEDRQERLHDRYMFERGIEQMEADGIARANRNTGRGSRERKF